MRQRKISSSAISKPSSRRDQVPSKAPSSLRNMPTVPQLPSPVDRKAQVLALSGHGQLQPAPLKDFDRAQLLERAHPLTLPGVAYIHFSGQMGLPHELADAAASASFEFLEEMCPRDALERLALSQLLLVHGRVAWLSKLLPAQPDAESLGIVSEACERALGSFGRLMRSFRDYREPKNSSTTVSIGQANVAGQQVVQNLMKEERREKNDEQTRIRRETGAASRPPLPPHEGRIALPADRHSTKPAVDKKHGSKNGRRKGAGSDECSPSRPTISRRHRPAKGYEKDDR
jgi:hypothetical protein